MSPLAELPYSVFRQLSLEGVPLRASGEFGEGLAAARWSRNEIAETSYRRPNHHTLSLYVAGGEQIRRRQGDRELRSFGAGSLCLMPAGVTTDWQVAGKVELFHLYIPRALVDRAVAAGLDRDPALVELLERPFFADPLLEQTIRHVFLCSDWHEPADRLALSHAAHLIIAHLLRRYSSVDARARIARGGLPSHVRRRVAEYVDANLGAPLSLADLAAVAGLSTYHFARAFKQATGESPHGFVLRRRIARAQRLLADHRLSLGEIADACGFSSQSHFTARFRRLTGVTPRRYRRLA
jgi:AraC family transcriptional regulator